MGMAGADIARIRSLNGLHLNPATLGGADGVRALGQFYFDDRLQTGSEYLKGFRNDIYVATPQVVFNIGKLSIGYEHKYFNLGRQSLTDDLTPEIISTFHSYEYTNTLAFAFRPVRFLSFGWALSNYKSVLGGGTSIISEESTTFTATGITYDIGINAQYPVEHNSLEITPSFGVSITDIGGVVTYSKVLQSDPMHTMFRAGMGVHVKSKMKLKGFTLFEGGLYAGRAKLLARSSENAKPKSGWDAVFNSWGSYTYFNGSEHITLSPREQFQRMFGIELKTLEILTFRAGSFSEDENNGDRQYTTIGFGIEYKYVGFDYSVYQSKRNYSPLDGYQIFQAWINFPLSLLIRN